MALHTYSLKIFVVLLKLIKTQPRRGSQARRQYQRTRVDNLRRDKGAAADADLAKALQNKLYPGVKSEQSVADRLEVVVRYNS